MSEVEDTKTHLTPEGKFAIVLLPAMVLVFVPFVFLGRPELGFGACISSRMTAIAIRSKWPLHRHRAFWPATALALLLQVPFLLFFPWSNRALRSLLLPLGLLEYVIVWMCIEAVVRLVPSQKEN